MRLNSRMSSLWKGSGISAPLHESLGAETLTEPVFENVDGSILLKGEGEGRGLSQCQIFLIR
jgi:hypothetical protein